MPKRSNKRPPTPAAVLARPQYKPSPELAAVIGTRPASRQAANGLVWDFIKAHGLQDPADRRVIVANDALRPIIGERVGMMQLGALLSKHLHKGSAAAAA